MANMRYFPKSGTTNEVGGIISTTSRKNTYKLVKIEMESVTWKVNRSEVMLCDFLSSCWYFLYLFATV
jgi:hypothetical protein